MLISFAVTAKLICVFVFVYANRWFSHGAARFMMAVFPVLLQIRMYLTVFERVCLLFVALCRAVPSVENTQTRRAPSSAADHRDTLRGFDAQTYLLDGAEFMYSSSEQLILYKRQGGIKTAISDFYKLNPTRIKIRIGDDKAYLKGSVGKRNLVLFIGPGLYPQMTITKFEPGNEKFISYALVFWYIGKDSKDVDHLIPHIPH